MTAAPKARPILFSAPMVRALLDGRKTQTRRIVKPQPNGTESVSPCHWVETGWSTSRGSSGCLCRPVRCPYGQPGDLLWVRETFCSDDDTPTIYKADGDEELYIKNHDLLCTNLPWKPSIHMPRWTSRLTLEITGVRVERLQDITEEDAKAEGIVFCERDSDGAEWYSLPEWKWQSPAAARAYRTLWESINGSGSWDANPWVWVLEFTVHRCNVDDLLKRTAA